LGVFLGGALVTAIADGWPGLKTYFGRIVRWRVGIQWYLFALLFPFALRLAAFGLNVVSGATPASFVWPVWSALGMEFLLIFFTISLGEEPGFRGFALPRLMQGRSALAASLILGVLHVLWHLPLLITGSEPLLIIPVILSGAVLNTWIFNRTNGSVLINMLLHTSIDLAVGIFNPLFSGAEAMNQFLWLAVLYVAVAILLPLLTGLNLGGKPEAVPDALRADQQPALK